MKILSEDLLPGTAPVNNVTDLDSMLRLTVDDAIQIALAKSANKQLEPVWYAKLLSKLGDKEKELFTLGLASNGINVTPAAIVEPVARKADLDLESHINNIKSRIQKFKSEKGYITEDEYNEALFGKDAHEEVPSKIVGEINAWLMQSMIPLKKNKPRKDISKGYEKKVKDQLKNPDVKKFKAHRQFTAHMYDGRLRVGTQKVQRVVSPIGLKPEDVCLSIKVRAVDVLEKQSYLVLSPRDKKVIMSFIDQKPDESKKLSTDGETLDINGLGGSGVAKWVDGKIRVRGLTSHSDQTVMHFLQKNTPKALWGGWMEDKPKGTTAQLKEKEFDWDKKPSGFRVAFDLDMGKRFTNVKPSRGEEESYSYDDEITDANNGKLIDRAQDEVEDWFGVSVSFEQTHTNPLTAFINRTIDAEQLKEIKRIVESGGDGGVVTLPSGVKVSNVIAARYNDANTNPYYPIEEWEDKFGISAAKKPEQALSFSQEQEELKRAIESWEPKLPNFKDWAKRVMQAQDFSDLRELWDELWETKEDMAVEVSPEDKHQFREFVELEGGRVATAGEVVVTEIDYRATEPSKTTKRVGWGWIGFEAETPIGKLEYAAGFDGNGLIDDEVMFINDKQIRPKFFPKVAIDMFEKEDKAQLATVINHWLRYFERSKGGSMKKCSVNDQVLLEEIKSLKDVLGPDILLDEMIDHMSDEDLDMILEDVINMRSEPEIGKHAQGTPSPWNYIQTMDNKDVSDLLRELTNGKSSYGNSSSDDLDLRYKLENELVKKFKDEKGALEYLENRYGESDLAKAAADDSNQDYEEAYNAVGGDPQKITDWLKSNKGADPVANPQLKNTVTDWLTKTKHVTPNTTTPVTSRLRIERRKRLGQITDRYDALGISHPDPKTVCKGQCEGTGLIPIHAEEERPSLKKLWDEAEKEKHTEDGWHFVPCPDCHGTGKVLSASRRTADDRLSEKRFYTGDGQVRMNDGAIRPYKRYTYESKGALYDVIIFPDDGSTYYATNMGAWSQTPNKYHNEIVKHFSLDVSKPSADGSDVEKVQE